jgi:transcriptional regulator with XRE-family HTH domain
MTQDELGQRLGVSQALVSQWERNETTPSAIQLVQIAVVLACGVEDLVAGADQQYDRWRRDLLRQPGMNDESPNRHSPGGASDVPAPARIFIEEVTGHYRAFVRQVSDVARDLTHLIESQPARVKAGGTRKTRPARVSPRRASR